MRKIFFFIIICILFSTQVVAQDCLDTPFLKILEQNPSEYIPQGIALCIHQKQCNRVRPLMDKLKKQDQVKFSYLYGSALANGDCYRQNIKEAEKYLSYAAKYSESAKINLLMFYVHFSSDYRNNKEYALSLAQKGYTYAYTFLADTYLQDETQESYITAYFWGKAAYIQIKNGYENLLKQNENAPENMKFDIGPTATFMRSVESALEPLRSQFPNHVIRKIDAIAAEFVASRPKNKNQNEDPLYTFSGMYGVLGTAIAPGQPEPQKLKKTSPPHDGIAERVKSYEDTVRALLLQR